MGFYGRFQQRQFQKVVILGNGGAARAVLHQCSKQDWGQIVLVARNHAKSQSLVNDLNKTLKHPIKQCCFTDLNE